MRVFKWTPAFTPSQVSSIVPVWVNFPELPTHLFRKKVLFMVASMIGTPLQIDDATLKLSKARACIELDLLKPRLKDFQIQICGATIVQRIEYEDIPHYCALCKHVGHRDSECYSKGDVPKPPPRKLRKRVAGKVEWGNAVVQEIGDNSKTMDQPEHLHFAKDTRYHTEHQTETMTSVNENSLPVDEVNIPCEWVETQMRKKWINLQQASKLFEGLKYFGVTVRQLKVWNDTDESEGEDDDVNPGRPRPVKIQDSVCSLNRNPAKTEDGEQFLVPSPTPPERNRRGVRKI
ncbi:UNVERIFIED_CONTAM: hypothetical protein Sindi_1811900 [Sesamum indicum]